ncbi:MAG: methylmalonyl Co-A mutase-associated GTPase MeaB [candidate division Zixibacteria bacterium]|nr:methylmalonyl Co-A mutase-associated GTPase MeaB [candidate division Zixibacteria bacterium]
MTVLEKFQGGDVRALSKLISYVEDGENGSQDLLGILYSKIGHALRIGITGPPGAGKSTLVNALVHQYLARKNKVGIIAVDPTSPFTGGALLGDRVRMYEFPSDGSVYFRSMATRGASGGLADATNNVATIFDAFGFDLTLIETVGVGQVELDIVDACDVVVVVLVPESGDAVQTMKAGLMEIGDIFVVNKADRPGAERIAAELKMTLDIRKHPASGWRPPIESTDAVNKKNIDRVILRIDEFIAFRKERNQFTAHRRDQIKRTILASIKLQFDRDFLSQVSTEENINEIIDRVEKNKESPYAIASEIYSRFA